MNRFHVNLSVSDIEKSVRFYTGLFGEPPTVAKPDYAKWILDDPMVNLSLSTHGARPGVDHVGIEAGSDQDFARLRTRLNRAESPVFDQPDVTCCYAESTKAWIRDPDGVAWETFYTRGAATVYGDGSRETAARTAHPDETPGTCCGTPP